MGGAEATWSVTSKSPGLDESIPKVEYKWKGLRVASWNVVSSVRRRSLEVVGILGERRVDICFLQEVRWKGEGKVLRTELVQYKLFWKGGEKGGSRGGNRGGTKMDR